jgi:hypothetical protein
MAGTGPRAEPLDQGDGGRRGGSVHFSVEQSAKISIDLERCSMITSRRQRFHQGAV